MRGLIKGFIIAGFEREPVIEEHYQGYSLWLITEGCKTELKNEESKSTKFIKELIIVGFKINGLTIEGLIIKSYMIKGLIIQRL